MTIPIRLKWSRFITKGPMSMLILSSPIVMARSRFPILAFDHLLAMRIINVIHCAYIFRMARIFYFLKESIGGGTYFNTLLRNVLSGLRLHKDTMLERHTRRKIAVVCTMVDQNTQSFWLPTDGIYGHNGTTSFMRVLLLGMFPFRHTRAVHS